MFKFDKRDAVSSAIRTPLERLPTEAGEAIGLAFAQQKRMGNSNSIRYGLKQEYQTILDDIHKQTGQHFRNPVNLLDDIEDAEQEGPTKFRAQIDTINKFIERNRAEVPGLKAIDPDEVWQGMVTKAKGAGAEWALGEEYAGGWAKAAGWVGSIGAGLTDPPTVAATVTGLAIAPFTMGASIPLTLGIGAGLNVGAEVIAEPGKRVTARVLDMPERDLGDLAKDAAIAGTVGVVIEGGGILAAKGIGAGFNRLRDLRNSQNPQERATGIATDRGVETVTDDNPSSYTAKAAAAESGGDLAAKAKTSSAVGKFQILEGTWNDLAKETGVPPVVKGQPDPRLNEDYQNAQMAAYTKRSTEALKNAGLATDDTNLYLAHFLGQEGAVDFLTNLKASPDAPATQFVDAASVAANRSVFFKKDGKPRTAQEIYRWADKKMRGKNDTGLPEQHIKNYDNAMAAMAADEAIPEPGIIAGKARNPHIEGLEQVDPNSLQVDARTFQFKEGGDDKGVTDRLKGVDKWEPDFAGISLVYEKADGSRFIADGHQRLALAKRTGAKALNARVLREADGWTPEAVRVRAAIKNISEGTGSPLDAARIMRAAKGADLPPLPPTSALVRQGRALAELGDEPFQMVINGVVPENYGAIVGRILKDPKLQEAAIKVLNKTNPENVTQAEAIVRQVGDTEVTTTTQSSLFGDESISESLFLERAKVMDASLKALRKDKAVFATLVDQAERIESAGNMLSRETNLERMTQDAKVATLIQRLASRKGAVSDALSEAARNLKQGARPGDATRSFLQSVRRAIDDGADGGSVGRGSGSMADGQQLVQPAEIRASQEAFEKQPDDFLDELINGQVDEAFADGRLSKDTAVYVEDPASGTLVKRKAQDILDEIDADQTLVKELTDCVEGVGDVA